MSFQTPAPVNRTLFPSHDVVLGAIGGEDTMISDMDLPAGARRVTRSDTGGADSVPRSCREPSMMAMIVTRVTESVSPLGKETRPGPSMRLPTIVTGLVTRLEKLR